MSIETWSNKAVDVGVKQLISGGTDTAQAIIDELRKLAGDPKDKAYRIVDRSLQRLRKAKTIRFVDRRWVVS